MITVSSYKCCQHGIYSDSVVCAGGGISMCCVFSKYLVSRGKENRKKMCCDEAVVVEF